MLQKLCGVLLALAFWAAAVPPPVEYDHDMLEQDLYSADLVAVVVVVSIDTTGTDLEETEYAVLEVAECLKGGLRVGESTISVMRRLNLVGGYAPAYQVGERSIACFVDQWRDGIHLAVNARAKFDVLADSSLADPPTGLGFADDLQPYTTQRAFTQHIRETIREREWLHYGPVLATTADSITFMTAIDLSGGAVLDDLHADEPTASRTNMWLTYTPCTGMCIDVYYVLDTFVVVGPREAGTHMAYRYKENTLIMAPFVGPDDSLSYQVYETSSVSPRPDRHPSSMAAGNVLGRTYDALGRALAGPSDTRREAGVPGIAVQDGRLLVSGLENCTAKR